MSKPNDKPARSKPKPFYKDDRLTLTFLQSESMITEIWVTVDGKEKKFKVKDFNILKAFKELEKFTNSKL